jgi:hypothetical protein
VSVKVDLGVARDARQPGFGVRCVTSVSAMIEDNPRLRMGLSHGDIHRLTIVNTPSPLSELPVG